MSSSRDRRQIRRTAPPGAARAQARARRGERQLDELLWQVAAEPDAPTDTACPAELRPERIAQDVARWRQTLASAPAARPRPQRAWLGAAAAALVLCAAGTASYWQDLGTRPAPASDAARAATAALEADAGSEKSWYITIARAPDARRERNARACSSESWYCAEAHLDSRQREL